jgi:hypothetical protein
MAHGGRCIACAVIKEASGECKKKAAIAPEKPAPLSELNGNTALSRSLYGQEMGPSVPKEKGRPHL